MEAHHTSEGMRRRRNDGPVPDGQHPFSEAHPYDYPNGFEQFFEQEDRGPLAPAADNSSSSLQLPNLSQCSSIYSSSVCHSDQVDQYFDEEREETQEEENMLRILQKGVQRTLEIDPKLTQWTVLVYSAPIVGFLSLLIGAWVVMKLIERDDTGASDSPSSSMVAGAQARVQLGPGISVTPAPLGEFEAVRRKAFEEGSLGMLIGLSVILFCTLSTLLLLRLAIWWFATMAKKFAEAELVWERGILDEEPLGDLDARVVRGHGGAWGALKRKGNGVAGVGIDVAAVALRGGGWNDVIVGEIVVEE